MRILFTCAGRRGYLFPYFRAAAPDVEILAADADSHASALLLADRAFLLPPMEAEGYRRTVAELCRRERVDLVFSLHDYDLAHLAALREELAAAGTRAVISSPEVIDRCTDKLRTSEFLARQGLPAPATWPAARAIELAGRGELGFPLFLKPRRGSASIGIHRVEDRERMEAIARLREDYLAQECLVGVEYGIDVLNDFEGRPMAVTVKRKLAMRGGETDRSVTVKEPDLIELGRRTGEALGHVGNLDMDVFVTDTGPRILELNPRFGGGYPGSHVAGADYPGKILALVRESRRPERLDEYEEGVYCFKSIAPIGARLSDLASYRRIGEGP